SFAASSTQRYLFLGIGVLFAPDRKLSFKIDGAFMNATVKEEALDTMFSESAIGFSVEGGILYDFSKTVFLELAGGYSYARLSGIDAGGEPKVGGLRSSVGLGFRF
ncbi:MAG: hypothetical protein GY940_26410, partial [bacterium]|nr:hypothetical protein [bacterium]